jgi:predicted O-methyltransferase YrrM
VALLESIDLVLPDGAKALYPAVLGLVQASLRPGAMVVPDNADHSRSTWSTWVTIKRYLSMPFGEDVELSVQLG